MPTITITRNPNFKSFWSVNNGKTEESEEIEGKVKAIRTALKIARRIGEERVLLQDKEWQLITA